MSFDQADFASIRDLDAHTFSFPAGGVSYGASYSQDGVTFSGANYIPDFPFIGGANDGAYGAGVSYLAGNYSDGVSTDATRAFNISFDGPVLALMLSSYNGPQTISFVFDGVTYNDFTIAGRGATTFLGLDIGRPGNLSLTLNSSTEIDVLGFQTSVPEPAAWVMMILGFGLVGGVLRRQRVRATVAYA